MIGHIDGEKIEIYNSLEVLNWGGGEWGEEGMDGKNDNEEL